MRRKIVGVLFALVLVVSLGLVMVPLAKVGATTNAQQFTVSGNFVIPARVTHITVETWGGVVQVVEALMLALGTRGVVPAVVVVLMLFQT